MRLFLCYFFFFHFKVLQTNYFRTSSLKFYLEQRKCWRKQRASLLLLLFDRVIEWVTEWKWTVSVLIRHLKFSFWIIFFRKIDVCCNLVWALIRVYFGSNIIHFFWKMSSRKIQIIDSIVWTMFRSSRKRLSINWHTLGVLEGFFDTLFIIQAAEWSLIHWICFNTRKYSQKCFKHKSILHIVSLYLEQNRTDIKTTSMDIFNVQCSWYLVIGKHACSIFDFYIDFFTHKLFNFCFVFSPKQQLRISFNFMANSIYRVEEWRSRNDERKRN